MKLLNDPLKKNDFILIGKIVGVHGLSGNVKVYSYAESLSVFSLKKKILIRNTTGLEKFYAIKTAKPHTRVILLSMHEINSRDQAEQLIGSEIFIERSVLPKLESGSFYWFEIIGLDVFTIANNYLGRVESVFSTGNNDVYVVQDPEKGQKSEVLVPALKSVVKSIDLSDGTMRVNLPEGLKPEPKG